jgi:hypothetical protein
MSKEKYIDESIEPVILYIEIFILVDINYCQRKKTAQVKVKQIEFIQDISIREEPEHSMNSTPLKQRTKNI